MILSDIGHQTFDALPYAVVPVLSVFIKWNVGAFFYNCWLQFGSIQLAHCLCDTTGKQKHRLPLHRYGGGGQVSELSSYELNYVLIKTLWSFVSFHSCFNLQLRVIYLPSINM